MLATIVLALIAIFCKKTKIKVIIFQFTIRI